MNAFAGRKFSWMLGLMILGVGGNVTWAADHNDAPLIRPNDQQDINDVYAFQSPANPQNVVFIMTVNPFVGDDNDGTLDPNTIYEFLIDTDGDAREDINYAFHFSRPNGLGQQQFLLQSGRATLARGRTDQNVPVRGGGTVRVGVFDDPFFFDLRVLDPDNPMTGTDTFAGANITALVLEIPSRNLRVRDIGVWAITETRGRQMDRMGRPAINTVLISSKDDFNQGHPADDVADFRQEVINSITALGNEAQAAALADALLPDILTIDTSNAGGFLNGRRLQDDVIDIELNLLTNGAVTTDEVDANDRAFSNTFPYLAAPHPLP